MQQIVINKCHGGFGLSHEAVMRYAKLQRITLYPTKKSYGYRYSTVSMEEYDRIYKKCKEINNWEEIRDLVFREYDLARDDRNLVAAVEELGEKANGNCAELSIVEVPNDVDWVIEEYDGIEWIAEAHRTWY